MPYVGANSFSTTLSAAMEPDHLVLQLNSLDGFPDIGRAGYYTYLTLADPASSLREPEHVKVNAVDRQSRTVTVERRDIAGTGTASYPAGSTVVEIRNIFEAIGDISADAVAAGGPPGPVVDAQARADIGTLRTDLDDTDQEFYDLSEAALQELFEIQEDATDVTLGTPGGRNNTVDLQAAMVAGKFSVLRIGRGPTTYDPILIRNDDIKDAQWTTYEMRLDGTPSGRNAELTRIAGDFPQLAIDTAGAYERIKYGQLNPSASGGGGGTPRTDMEINTLADARIAAEVDPVALQGNAGRWPYTKLPSDLQSMMGGDDGSGSIRGPLVVTGTAQSPNGVFDWVIESDFSAFGRAGPPPGSSAPRTDYLYLYFTGQTDTDRDPIWGDDVLGWWFVAESNGEERGRAFVPLGFPIPSGFTLNADREASTGETDEYIRLSGQVSDGSLVQITGLQARYSTTSAVITASVKIYTAIAPGGGGGSPAAPTSGTPLPALVTAQGTDVTIAQPATANTWSAYSTLYEGTLADAGTYLCVADVVNDTVLRPIQGPGDRFWMGYRIVRRRGSVDTVLGTETVYARNSYANATANLAKIVNAIGEFAANDKLLVEVRLGAQTAGTSSSSPGSVTWTGTSQSIRIQRLPQLWGVDAGVKSLAFDEATRNLTVTLQDDSTQTINIPGGGGGSSGGGVSPAHSSDSAGSVQFIGDSVDLNLLHTPGEYVALSRHWTGTNSPFGQSGEFKLYVNNIPGVAGTSNGRIYQRVESLLDPRQAYYDRITPAGDGTSTDIPASIAESWTRYDVVAGLPDDEADAETTFVTHQAGSTVRARQDHPITFAQSAGAQGNPFIGQSGERPTHNLQWTPSNSPGTPNRLSATFVTSDLGGKTLAATWARGVRYAGAVRLEAPYTHFTSTIPGLLTTASPTVQLNWEFTDGSFLWGSQIYTEAHAAKLTFDAMRARVQAALPLGVVKGYTAKLPNDQATRPDNQIWMTDDGIYKIVPRGAGTTTLQVTDWVPALSENAYGFVSDFQFVNDQTSQSFTRNFGSRPNGLPDSIKGLFRIGNDYTLVADRDLFGFDFDMRYLDSGDHEQLEFDKGAGAYTWRASTVLGPGWTTNAFSFDIFDPDLATRNATAKHWSLLGKFNRDIPVATPTTAGLESAEDKAIVDRVGAIADATPTTAGYMSGADKTKLDGLEASPPGVNSIPANWQSGADPKAAVGSRVELLDPDTFAIYRELRVAATTDAQNRAIRAWDTSPAIGSLEGVTDAIRGVVGIFSYPANYAIQANRNKVYLLMSATSTPSPASIEIDGTAHTVQGSSTDQFREVNGLTYNSLVPGTVYRFNATDASGKFFPDLQLVPHNYVFDGRVPVLDAQAVTIADIDSRIAEWAQRGQPNPHRLILDQTLALNATQAGSAHLNTPVEPSPTFSVEGSDVLQISVQWQTSTGTIRISPPAQYGLNQVTNARLRGRPAYEAVAALAGNVGVPVAEVEVRNASRVIATATLYVARTTGNLLTTFMRWTPGSNPDAGATGAVQAVTEIIASPLG